MNKINDITGLASIGPTEWPAQDRKHFKVAILLTEGYSLLSLASLSDVFSAVQTVSPADNVEVTLMSVDGYPVRSASRWKTEPDTHLSFASTGFSHSKKYDLCVICSGPRLSGDESKSVLKLVRMCQRNAIPICVMGGAIQPLAMSGFISKATDHWSRIPGNQETLPHIKFENAIFVQDGNIFSCAGELGTLDFALSWISEKIGTYTASLISNHLLIETSRAPGRFQTCTIAHRFKDIPEILMKAIEMILTNIEDPVRLTTIGPQLGVSRRQIERLFKRYLLTTPGKFYKRERLEHSLKLIEQTNMKLLEISIASGFNCPSAFCKSFKKEFGYSPRNARSSNRYG